MDCSFCSCDAEGDQKGSPYDIFETQIDFNNSAIVFGEGAADE